MRTWLAGFLLLILFSVQLAAAQEVVSATSKLDSYGAESYQVSLAFKGSPADVQAITGAPYSAEVVSEGWQMLPDGTRSEQNRLLSREYRDQQGRTRSERKIYLGPNAPESPFIVEITDFLAGYRYLLDPEKKIAHRSALIQAGSAKEPPPPGHRTASVASLDSDGNVTLAQMQESVPPASSAPNPDQNGSSGAVTMNKRGTRSKSGQHFDSLGVRKIEGVSVEGVRYTNQTSSAGSNEQRSQLAVSEVWTSPELKVVVLSKVTEPENSERLVRLTHLKREVPDPQLFEVPAGYEVKDETGDYQITLHLHP